MAETFGATAPYRHVDLIAQAPWQGERMLAIRKRQSRYRCERPLIGHCRRSIYFTSLTALGGEPAICFVAESRSNSAWTGFGSLMPLD